MEKTKMQNLRILNRKESKKILEQIEKQWGSVIPQILQDFVFLENNSGRVSVVKKDVFSVVDDSLVRVATVGMYLASTEHDEVRLSIEASQMVGPHAERNVVEILPEDERRWMMGQDLTLEESGHKGVTGKGYVIVRCGKDFLGCAKVRDKQLMNYYPKSRRISAL